MPIIDDILKRFNPGVTYTEFTGSKGEGARGVLYRTLFDDLPSPKTGSLYEIESFHFPGSPKRAVRLKRQLSDDITQPARHKMQITSNFYRPYSRGGGVTVSLENLTADEVRRLKKALATSPELFDTLVDVPYNISVKDNVLHHDFIEQPQPRLESWVRKLLEAQSKIKLDERDNGLLYAEARYKKERTAKELRALLKARNLRNLGLMAAGAGASGAAGSLLDDKDRMLSAVLSTAAGSAALPAGLATLGGKKLKRLITRKPLVGLAAGTLGGIGGFLGNTTIQDFLQKIR